MTHFGTVIWFRGSYGFLKNDDGGPDIFVHFKGILPTQRGEHRMLEEGECVEFEIETSQKSGKPIATKVRRLDKVL